MGPQNVLQVQHADAHTTGAGVQQGAATTDLGRYTGLDTGVQTGTLTGAHTGAHTGLQTGAQTGRADTKHVCALAAPANNTTPRTTTNKDFFITDSFLSDFYDCGC